MRNLGSRQRTNSDLSDAGFRERGLRSAGYRSRRPSQDDDGIFLCEGPNSLDQDRIDELGGAASTICPMC